MGSKNGVVVQLVRIPACHAGGRGFESRPYRQFFEQVLLRQYNKDGPFVYRLVLKIFILARGVRFPHGLQSAEIAQLVEHNLAKVRVASSSLVFRSTFKVFASLAQLARARDL